MEHGKHHQSSGNLRAPEPLADRADTLDQAPTTDAAVEIEPVPEEPPQPSRWAQLVGRLRNPPQPSRDAKSRERTRGLVILAGTTLACLFVFLGLFTTDSGANRKEHSTKPNLRRPLAAVANPEAPVRSPVPQLSVTEQPSEESGELNERDLLGTMRNRAAVSAKGNSPIPLKNAQPSGNALSTIKFDDLTPPPPHRLEVMDWNAAVADYEARLKPAPAPTTAAPPVASTRAEDKNDSLRKSSIIFVRAGADTESRQPAPIAVAERKRAGLLPQGTALVARLQHSVSSAAKAPVTAVIEYNYQQNGQLTVPAGTKAYGQLAQATPQGYVTIKFHTLEYPTGEQEKIDGSALSMDRSALRGEVNGKGGAKKFLTRTLTGIGSIASFAVGGQGLSGNLNNSALLRERISSNVALAGEQELDGLSYQQNIVVTVPANTRFYLVLNEPGIDRPAASPSAQSAAIPQASDRDTPSEQELREIIALRDELREMNRLMQPRAPKLEPSPPENQ
jgi:hypothetical protein